VLNHLGGPASLLSIWDQLPAGRANMFNGPYTPVFLAGYASVAMLSYNGGTWNLAARYLGAPTARSARNSALLSGSLYVIWPLFVFFPMWAAPLLLPNLADPSQSYVLLTQKFLPSGFVGLVLASMFAATMAMTTSDMNTISAVLTRDILPVAAPRWRARDERQGLRQARYATLIFTLLTLVVGLEAERFGGVLGLLVSWFAALIGPVSVPMLLGLLPIFRHAGVRSAVASILAGFGAFALVTYGFSATPGARVLAPIATSLAVFAAGAWLARNSVVSPAVDQLLRSISSDPAPAAAET
jgi:SSS family solute:Na+ symporter